MAVRRRVDWPIILGPKVPVPTVVNSSVRGKLAELLSAFDGGRPLAELAEAHARTRGGIQARLIRHGRLAPEGNRPIGGPGKWRQSVAPLPARIDGGRGGP